MVICLIRHLTIINEWFVCNIAKICFFPDYRQDNDLWIALQDYQNADWANLIQLWKFYNLHLIQVIQSVDVAKLDSYWCDFEGIKVMLKDMIEGYWAHLHLHIKEIHKLII